MNTYAILLRGVMPTGKNKVPMTQLRDVIREAGFENVQTYIQSGNVILQTTLSASELEVRIHDLILKNIGPDLTVVVRTRKEIENVLEMNPFDNQYDISRIFYVLFKEHPKMENVEKLMAITFDDEDVKINTVAGYMFIPHTYGSKKLSNNFLEKKLGVSATMRN